MQTFESSGFELYPSNDDSFEKIALDLFRFQAKGNPVYHQYLTTLGVEWRDIGSVSEIPFLPVSLFKTHPVKTGAWIPEATFTSSGTTAETPSRHEVYSMGTYLNHARKTFEAQVAPLKDTHVLCLLPSYLERTGSSLVAMANHFIEVSGSPYSGFYLHNLDALVSRLEFLRGQGKVLLLGVSFALWELAEKYEADLSHCMVMETGGMKGRRQEIIREELHSILKESFNVGRILSEYGMTELLSQAYSTGDGWFRCPPSMKVLIRQVNDPFCPEARSAGIINVVDLANTHTCAFIETQDLGRIDKSGHFEVLGRKDNSDVRGCNLMVN